MEAKTIRAKFSDSSTGCPSESDACLDIADVNSCCARAKAALDCGLLGQSFDEAHDLPLRGWAMRRGRLRKLARPKTGKAAIRAEVQGQGQEVLRGRSVFKRSLHASRGRWKSDVKDSKAKQRRDLELDINCELDSWWDWQEENWEADSSWWADSHQQVMNTAKKQVISDPWGILASYLKGVGGIIEPDSFRKSRTCPFVQLQKTFLTQHGVKCCKHLQLCNPGTIHLRPAPLSEEARLRFLNAKKELPGTLEPAFHGTNACNFPSIFERGLLIPGEGNELRVANGSAHGKGIYTAKVTNPSLSRGFCSDNQVLICGVLDDALPGSVAEYSMGIRTVSRESETVRHVGDAMVVFDSRRVTPLFVASLHSSDRPKGLATAVAFDWNRHYYLIGRMFGGSPQSCKQLRSGPPCTRLKKRSPPRNSYSYLCRRAARKRSLKGI
eukprot:TRINITY_DN57595_c0_g1_i1.p1 TRINITY_DN57595_c0_g1~~TRINITY_DN57595_c0_g1_i1.p1  ORF type:complete len:440 (+),score=59.77 TRINITY_DN57595_c0_g1_i1:109-1428(+)